MIGQWRIGRTIGKGSSGRVKIAKHAISGKYAAIKIVPKGLILTSRMSMSEAGARADKVLLGIEREIVIMKLIDHPNVLNLYDVWETSGELYLIMEYVPGGELFDYLVKRGRLPLTEALQYFQQIIHAVDYCHRFNICHRDLKPENLLLDKDKNIKVADFGMAAWEAGERMLETSCGSPHYASPEIVAGRAYHGSSSDIWSCGIILFALITGRLPFDDDNIRVLLLKVKTGVFEMPSEIQGPSRDLLFRMLEKDPERRITMPQILQHPFFISQPPKVTPGRPLVPPPSLDEVEKPVNSRSEIDPDIMGNLKTLWHGASDDEIVDALLSREKTWEKAIYHLLVKYRTRHLENYNMDDEEHIAEKREVKRQDVTYVRASTVAALGESVKMNASRAPPSPPPARPAAPTPTKAQAGGHAKEKLVVPRATPQGPRPPLSPRASYLSAEPKTPRSESPVSHPAPSIVFQSATPSRERPADGSIEGALAAIQYGGPERPLSPINAPQVANIEVQRFFDEVAQQLNTITVRSSVGSASSTSTGISGPITPLLPSPGIRQQGHQADSSRFEDADDDETDILTNASEADAYSVRSGTQGGIGIGIGIGLGLGGFGGSMMGDGPSRRESMAESNRRWSTVSSGSNRVRPPAPPSPFLYDRENLPPRLDLPHQQIGSKPQRPAPPPPSHDLMTPLGDSILGRDNSYVYIELEPNSPSSSWNGTFNGSSKSPSLSKWTDPSVLRKKKKPTAIEVTPFSPDLSGNSGPKRSWFQNLFHFKPAPFTLWSYENISTTSKNVQQLLMSYGVRVAVERVDGQLVLRCKVDTMKGELDPFHNFSAYEYDFFSLEC